MAAPDAPVDDAQKRASGSSFYNAMRILPRRQRTALFEIYAFCRSVDDVADDPGPKDGRLTELGRWRAAIEGLYRGEMPARMQALAEPVREFGLQKADFLAIVDGMEMDVTADIRTPSFETLDLYCDRVASAVGRLCVRVFGMGAEDGSKLAHHLGRALQLTNILRDLDEDAAMGRLYLPREALAAAGISASEPAPVLMDANLGEACAWVIDRARSHFTAADELMRHAPRRAIRAPRIMGEAYKLILAGLVARGWTAPRPPIRLRRAQLAWIVLRCAVL